MDENEKMEFLANSIKKAKMVMDRVESGNLEPNNSAPRGLTEADVDRLLDSDSGNSNQLREQQVMQNPKAVYNLKNSKMPESILQSFRDNPISDPSMPIGGNSMMNEIAKKIAPTVSKPSTQPINITAPGLDVKLIEYIIKKTVEATLEEISKKTSIDETFQIKIGDKTFGGKLTVLKENVIKK